MLALLRSGLFDELPGLKVVVPMIDAATFLFVGIADHATAVLGGGIGLSDSHRGTQGSDPGRQYVTSVGVRAHLRLANQVVVE